MDKTWKKFERWVGSFLSELGDQAVRIPVTGRTRGDSPDVTSNYLSIECKYRKQIPLWIKDAMDQAVKSNTRGQDNKTKVPVVFLREKRMPLKDTLVMMRLEDLLESIK